ncbi:hypothetical protein O181_096397 [Austropuccinia psidii MF-1]|uniref:Uncharacterized protein n=1 Tax=Austropuccinia psidii MF-1 TaxID=1389203 RepID=A0A9Q3J768_9BASI|nr:hypothetical protein [Austropuccinia psidii MF-1]
MSTSSMNPRQRLRPPKVKIIKLANAKTRPSLIVSRTHNYRLRVYTLRVKPESEVCLPDEEKRVTSRAFSIVFMFILLDHVYKKLYMSSTPALLGCFSALSFMSHFQKNGFEYCLKLFFSGTFSSDPK